MQKLLDGIQIFILLIHKLQDAGRRQDNNSRQSINSRKLLYYYKGLAVKGKGKGKGGGKC